MSPRNSDTLALVVFVLVVPALLSLLADYRAPIVAWLLLPKAPYYIAAVCALALFAFLMLCAWLAFRTKPSERPVRTDDIFSAKGTRRPWGES